MPTTSPHRSRTYDIPVLLRVHVTDSSDEQARAKLIDALTRNLTIDADTGNGIVVHQAAAVSYNPSPVLLDTDPDYNPGAGLPAPHQARFDAAHPCLIPLDGEELVTYDHARPFPALVHHDASGYRAPTFRPSVQLQLALYVAEQNANGPFPEDQHVLAIAPDEDSVAHLVPDRDEDPVRYGLEAVYLLHDPTGQPRHNAIGGWNWTWGPWSST